MSVRISIIDGPLARGVEEHAEGAGARLVFEGVVRRMESERAIAALEYQAYEPMASRQLARLGEELAARFRLMEVAVEHSRGRVRVGEVSFRLVIASKHRKEGLAAMDEFIDRMKRDVPIWKSPVWADAGAAAPGAAESRA